MCLKRVNYQIPEGSTWFSICKQVFIFEIYCTVKNMRLVLRKYWLTWIYFQNDQVTEGVWINYLVHILKPRLIFFINLGIHILFNLFSIPNNIKTISNEFWRNVNFFIIFPPYAVWDQTKADIFLIFLASFIINRHGGVNRAFKYSPINAPYLWGKVVLTKFIIGCHMVWYYYYHNL